ncbi:hypothetical protein DYB38_008710, partial [Aphanomyces astaci]
MTQRSRHSRPRVVVQEISPKVQDFPHKPQHMSVDSRIDFYVGAIEEYAQHLARYDRRLTCDLSDDESPRRADVRKYKPETSMGDDDTCIHHTDGDMGGRRGATLTCRIVCHTIDKKESRKFRRSIHGRPYVITFIMHVMDSEDTSTVKRTYLQFKSLHKQVGKMTYNSPSTSTELERYIDNLFALDTIASCDLLRGFLDDCPLSDGTDEDDNDNEDGLDVRESTTVRIQRGQSYSISVKIPCAGADVSFHFSTQKYDVGFTITLNHDHVLHMYSKEQTLKGTVTCPTSGVCVLTWDNSFVWRRSKTVTYRADVVLPFH